ncbi:MAG TPA: hypothetical protein VFC93_11000 [Chloroflexota bacterium]|nr:hypothetical protein [Chloroflexota bacterium]
MGAGVDPLRAAYGSGVAPLPLNHTLTVAVATLVVALLMLLALFLLMGLPARGAGSAASASVARPDEPPFAAQAGPPDVARDAMLATFLARLERLAELAADPAVRADPQKLRLIQAALLSTYRDCEALGAGGQARALLHLPG